MKAPINPVYPIPAVASVDQLMAIALAVEEEAARRYEDLARRMEQRGETELAELFAELAELERSHGEELAAWARRGGGCAPAPLSTPWSWPETFADDSDAPLLDPFRALAMAVQNEERTFALYSYLAALSDGDPVVRDRAESLAREELNHVALLRSWRRRAWRTRSTASSVSVPSVGNVTDLRLLAGGLEIGCAEIEEVAANALTVAGRPDAVAALAHCAAADRARARQLDPAQLQPVPSATVAAARRAEVLKPGRLTATGAMRLALRNAEEVVEVYLAVAERGGNDEAVLTQAQHLAESAVMRLALIRAHASVDGRSIE